MVRLALFKYEADIYIPGSTEDILYSSIRTRYDATSLSIGGVTNDVPEEDLSSNIPIRVNRGRSYGITARHVNLVRLVGEAEGTAVLQRIYRRVPVFQPTIFDGYLATINPAIIWEGQGDWQLVNGIAEKYHLLYGVAASEPPPGG